MKEGMYVKGFFSVTKHFTYDDRKYYEGNEWICYEYYQRYRTVYQLWNDLQCYYLFLLLL